MKKLLNKKGFTLIELIVVIAIIAILAAILIPALLDYIEAAQYAKDQSNARSHYTAAMLYAAAGGTQPVLTGCTYDVTDNVLSDFECTFNGYTFTVGNNFDPKNAPAPTPAP